MPRTTDRTIVRRHPERSVPDEFGSIMEAASVAQVGFCVGGQPHIIPLTYQFDAAKPDVVYLHGARESRMQQVLATGAPICICVTLIDGLVYSRTAMNHSMNYRSAICFGRGEEVTDLDVKRRAFEAMTLRYFPGRTADVDYEGATAAQLEATAMFAITIEESSAKVRRGGPNGPTDADPSALGTCGVAPPR
jgi:nitroimidazol reductase NimA-like FMN-containing flavoprotein (pyridoxamine 5'-phosphate oxidase superfamily)